MAAFPLHASTPVAVPVFEGELLDPQAKLFTVAGQLMVGGILASVTVIV